MDNYLRVYVHNAIYFFHVSLLPSIRHQHTDNTGSKSLPSWRLRHLFIIENIEFHHFLNKFASVINTSASVFNSIIESVLPIHGTLLQ